MKRKIIEHLKYYLLAFAGCLFLAVLQSCMPESQEARIPQESLPVEQNFEHEKIWTAEDEANATALADTVNYNVATDDVSGWVPDNITKEDIQLIESHNKRQIQSLLAGAKK